MYNVRGVFRDRSSKVIGVVEADTRTLHMGLGKMGVECTNLLHDNPRIENEWYSFNVEIKRIENV